MSTESTEALIERVLAEQLVAEYGETVADWRELRSTRRIAAAITQALAEREVAYWGVVLDDLGSTDHYDTEADARRAMRLHGGLRLVRIITEPAAEPTDTAWAEDAAASHRALYDTDSGRRDNWSDR